MYNKSDNFLPKGFVVEKFFLEENQVTELRNKILKFDENSIKSINNINSLDSIYNNLFSEKLLNILKEQFNQTELFILNHIKLQINMHNKETNSNKYQRTGGWHQDSGGNNNYLYLGNKNNLYFKIGIFLQENKKSYGGGIDIIPNYSYFRHGKKNFLKTLFSRTHNSVKIRLFDNTLTNKSGDLVMFDSQTYHRSSPKINNKEGKKKIVIYFNVCNRNLLENVLNKNILISDENVLDKEFIKTNYKKNNIHFLNKSISHLLETKVSS